jgi:hypothetical protein
MSHSMAGQTADCLRAKIDRGQTGDKVPASDPAAAPLGTDEEAAGASPSAEAVGQAQSQETSAPVKHPEPRGGPGYAWVLILFIPFFGAAIVVLSLIFR